MNNLIVYLYWYLIIILFIKLSYKNIKMIWFLDFVNISIKSLWFVWCMVIDVLRCFFVWLLCYFIFFLVFFRMKVLVGLEFIVCGKCYFRIVYLSCFCSEFFLDCKLYLIEFVIVLFGFVCLCWFFNLIFLLLIVVVDFNFC